MSSVANATFCFYFLCYDEFIKNKKEVKGYEGYQERWSCGRIHAI